MFDRLDELAGEYAALERDLADPAVHADPDRARALGRRYGELGPVTRAYREWQQVSADEETAHELAGEDASFDAEAGQLRRRREELEKRLRQLLVPKDPSDARDVILEVKAGEGGEESALFLSRRARQTHPARFECSSHCPCPPDTLSRSGD